MSSSGGGIVVKPGNASTPQAFFSKAEGQIIADCLTSCGHSDMAAKVQTVVDAAT